MSGVPPGSVCGSGWLVFEVLLPSRAGGLGGNRALWFTAAGCLLGQDPLGTGPPGAAWSSQPDGLSSVRGPLLSLWSLVSDLSPRPLSPSPPLSLSLFLFSLLSLLCILLILLSHPRLPLHLPSSSTFCPMLMVKVTATETSPHLPPKGLWLCPGPQ